MIEEGSPPGGDALDRPGIISSPKIVVWELSKTPRGQLIQLPRGTDAVYMLYSYGSEGAEFGLAHARLAGREPDDGVQALGTFGLSTIGVAIWHNPPLGIRHLRLKWDVLPESVPTCLLVFLKNMRGRSWSNIGIAQARGGNSTDASVASELNDLVVRIDTNRRSVPKIQPGWRSLKTSRAFHMKGRISLATPPGQPETLAHSEAAILGSYAIMLIDIPTASSETDASALGTVRKEINESQVQRWQHGQWVSYESD